MESNQIGIFKTSNLVEGRDKYGHVFQFEYDQQNRMIAKTDRRGHTFHFEYDENGRCVHSYGDRGLLEVRLRYLPQVTFVTKADGGQWAYRYNEAGVITEIVDPYGGVQKFNLDPEGRLAKEVDPNGNVTRYIYNGIGALIGKEDPLGNFSPIPEDPEFPEPDDHEVADCPIEWEYGRLLAFEDVSSPPDPYKTIWHQLIKYINGSIKPPIKPISAGPFYDETGCLLREVDSEGYAEEWTYDANGNIATYRDRDGSVYTYDYMSWNLLGWETNPLGHTETYGYTFHEQLSSVTDAGGSRSEYAYDLKDRLIEIRRHGTVKETYHYDKADNLIEKRDHAGQPLLSFEIDAGNLDQVQTYVLRYLKPQLRHQEYLFPIQIPLMLRIQPREVRPLRLVAMKSCSRISLTLRKVRGMKRGMRLRKEL